MLERYGAELTTRDGEWISKWKLPGLKNFYVEYLFFHEIGHHVDRYLRH
ncbi:hypothetical protein OJ996_23390 [Luteolibacter sp. GHJ8]|uniref:Uncharacterized protein n=1 Tax=Luteolibacter rhizosphaerae TaxID=2989719 RepID=A0ABT3G9N7_9BACT|nr:hypothetical protein [Luteolibacter rhizosphaerae]MCW1916551.1 hypothetical protein [Luteolibacter rhizosphaerae]